MILQSLRVRSFRAHAENHVHFSPGINLIYGPNGIGKTNLLEAIHYLALTKSFITSNDQYALRSGAPYFELEGRFAGEQRRELRIRLAFVPSEGKKVLVNGAPLQRLSELVGQVPVVTVSPADSALTAGGPEERRRFLDNTLSQGHPVYLDDLMKYRRALQQRNALLAEYRRTRRLQEALMDSWNTELITLGSRIIFRRLGFLSEFKGYLMQAHAWIEAVGEEPSISYQGIGSLESTASEEEIRELFSQQIAAVSLREQEQGRTLVGPHRDELCFYLNAFPVRQYGSQGQHRTFGLALKLGKYLYLKENLNETPLLLLDDVFGALDPHRTEVFLKLLQSPAIGQSFITAATDDPFLRFVPFAGQGHQRLCLEPAAHAPSISVV